MEIFTPCSKKITQQEFNELLEYSLSEPTLIVHGKKWKSRRVIQGWPWPIELSDEWYFHQVFERKGTDKIIIITRSLEVVDAS